MSSFYFFRCNDYGFMWYHLCYCIQFSLVLPLRVIVWHYVQGHNSVHDRLGLPILLILSYTSYHLFTKITQILSFYLYGRGFYSLVIWLWIYSTNTYIHTQCYNSFSGMVQPELSAHSILNVAAFKISLIPSIKFALFTPSSLTHQD